MEKIVTDSVANHDGEQTVAMPLDQDNRKHIKKLNRKRRQEEIGKSLSAFLIRISNNIETADKEKRLRMVRNMIKSHKFLDNEFYGYVDQNMSWAEVRRDNADEIWYVDNQLYPYWRTALMEMSRTQTEVLINANAEGNAEMEAAARFAKKRYDSIRDRTFKPRLRQTENAYALLNGITFRYTFPQFDSPGHRTEKVPVMREEENSSTKTKLCANCYKPVQEVDDETKDILGAEYIEKSEPKCINCGSDMFEEYDTDLGPDVVIDYKDVSLCENAWVIPNPVGIIVSMYADSVQSTPYIKWKMFVYRALLEEKFPGIEIPHTGTKSIELKYIANQQVSSAGGNAGLNTFQGSGEIGSNNGEQELELIEFEQHWLDYDIYCNVTFDEPMKLSDGRTLPAGETLGSAYPKGMYFARMGDLIADVWDEDKNRKWTSSPYEIRPGSMYGSGSMVAMSDQEATNDLERLIYANAWNNGVPREFVDESIIPELSTDPTIPTRIEGDGTQTNIIGTAWAQAPAVPLGQEIYALKDRKASDIQNKIGAMSGQGAGGLADAQKWGDTATAISIKRDLAVGRFSPNLELMADQLDCEQAKQFLLNEQEFYSPQQWKMLIGDYDDEGLQAFLKCDIVRDLNFTIAPGSHMPKSDAQVQSKLISLGELLPALAQTQNLELINYAFEVFGVPKELGGWNSDRAQANRVVQRFSDLVEEFIQAYGDAPTNDLNDPMVQKAVLAIEQHAQMPVDTFLDNHAALQEAYRDLRATDEGRAWPNLLIAAVAGRVVQHQLAETKQQAFLKSQADAIMAPEIEKEQAALEEQKNAEREAQEAEVLDKTVEYNDRDENRAHELEMQRREHEQRTGEKLLELQAQAEQTKDSPASGDAGEH